MNKIVWNLKKLNYRDLVIFLIPSIIFMYYLYVFNPGVLTYDSFDQLSQIAYHNFGTWHPFFHTFIEMLCLKIYPDPKSICILQILTFSTIWMIICKYNRNDEVKTKNFIAQVIITLIISLIPINAIYSITLWKDILFSYFLLFSCFLIEVIVDRKGDVSYLFIAVLALTMVFICQLRPNGIIIILVLLIALAFYFFKKNRDSKLYILLPVLTIIFILLISSLNVAYEVKDNQKDAVFDKTTHILAYYDLNVNVSNDDKMKIHEMISEKDIKEQFNIYYTDNTFHVSNESVFDADKSSYIKLVIKYSLKNPLKFLEYAFQSSNIVYDVTRDHEWIGYVYTIEVEKNRDGFYEKSKKDHKYSYNNVSSKNAGNPEFKNLKSFAYSIEENIVSDTLLDSPALYMYLAFVLLGALYFITRLKGLFLIYLPCLSNIFTIAVSTPYQANRYLYPNLLVFYLLVIILIKLLCYKGNEGEIIT